MPTLIDDAATILKPAITGAVYGCAPAILMAYLTWSLSGACSRDEANIILVLSGGLATTGYALIGPPIGATCGFFIGCKRAYDNHNQAPQPKFT